MPLSRVVPSGGDSGRLIGGEMARRPLDFYETPAHYVEQLLARVPIKGRVFEPCVGDGAISRSFPGCETNDINLDCAANFQIAPRFPL